MFFTRVGKVVAHLMLWPALAKLLLGFSIAYSTPDMESNSFWARRYLGAATSGEAINESQRAILIALAFGVLCEISARRKKPDEQE